MELSAGFRLTNGKKSMLSNNMYAYLLNGNTNTRHNSSVIKKDCCYFRTEVANSNLLRLNNIIMYRIFITKCVIH